MMAQVAWDAGPDIVVRLLAVELAIVVLVIPPKSRVDQMGRLWPVHYDCKHVIQFYFAPSIHFVLLVTVPICFASY